MTSRSDFDDAQWHKVTNAVIIAAAVISASDDTGDEDGADTEEMQAFRDNLDKLAAKHKKSELVQDVLVALQSADMAEFWDTHGAIGAAVSHENPLEDQLAVIRDAADIINEVADKKEAKALKAFIYDCGRGVAEATKEGFFALSSSISKREDFYLRQLRSMLGI